MLWKQLLIVLLGFFWSAPTSISPLPAPKSQAFSKVDDVSPELREKAFGLLVDVIKESEQLKLPQNRLEIQIHGANLLWEKDEKQARQVFAKVQDELQRLFEEVKRPNNGKGANTYTVSDISSLSGTLIETISNRDPILAEKTLHALEYIIGSGHEYLDHLIFHGCVKNDFQRAYQQAERMIGKEPLKSDSAPSQGYWGLLDRLQDIYQVNHEIGGRLATEIFANVRSKHLYVNLEGPNLWRSNSLTGNSNSYGGNSNSKPSNAVSGQAGNRPTNINIAISVNANASFSSNKRTNSNSGPSRSSITAANVSPTGPQLPSVPKPLPNANSSILSKKTESPNDIDFEQVRAFLKLADASRTNRFIPLNFHDYYRNQSANENIANTNEKSKPYILTESEASELASWVAKSLLDNRSWFDKTIRYTVADVYPELLKYAPSQAQKLRQQRSESELQEFDRLVEGYQRTGLEVREKSLDELLQEARMVRVEDRDKFYVEVLEGILWGCSYTDEERAEVFLKIQRKESFPFETPNVSGSHAIGATVTTYAKAYEKLKDTLSIVKAKKGDILELRKVLVIEKYPARKAFLLSNAAGSLAKKGDIQTANKLLAEAKQLLPLKFKTDDQFRGLMAYANAVAVMKPVQSFSLLESLTPQVNETLHAGVRSMALDKDRVVGDEVLFYELEFRSALHIEPSVPLIKTLAQADFERLKQLTEKFSRTDIRLFARWHIVDSLLNSEAVSAERDLVRATELCDS